MPISKSDLSKYKSPGVYVVEHDVDEWYGPPLGKCTDEEKLDSVKLEVIEKYLRRKKLEHLNEQNIHNQ